MSLENMRGLVPQLWAFLCEVRDEMVRESKPESRKGEPLRYLGRRYAYGMQRFGEIRMAHDCGIQVTSVCELNRVRDDLESAWDSIMREAGYRRLTRPNSVASQNVCWDADRANCVSGENTSVSAWV